MEAMDCLDSREYSADLRHLVFLSSQGMAVKTPKVLTCAAIFVIGYCVFEVFVPVAWAWLKDW